MEGLPDLVKNRENTDEAEQKKDDNTKTGHDNRIMLSHDDSNVMWQPEGTVLPNRG